MAMKIGWISYLNLLPLRLELLRNGFVKEQFIGGVPSQVNQWLSEGRVQIAPCSSICLVSCPQHEMAMPLGVTALGEVRSVYLGMSKEDPELIAFIQKRQNFCKEIFQEARIRFPQDARSLAQYVKDEFDKDDKDVFKTVPRLKFTPASASSTTLTKLLFKLWFGKKAYDQLQDRLRLPSDPTAPAIELLVGDEALGRAHEFEKRLDLGSLWHELSNLPFVYAVWQSRGALPAPAKRHILQLAQVAQNRMHIQPSFYYPEHMPKDTSGADLALAGYWKGINYKLGSTELHSLLIFLCLARVFSLIQTDQAAVSKIARWQKYSTDPGITM